jgi:hypothetical protein
MKVIREIVKPNTSFTRIFVKQTLEDGSEIYKEFDPEDPEEN